MSTLSAAAREAAIGCPEQFLAAKTLLSAAAEARRSADLNDDTPELVRTLRTAATAASAAAAALVQHIAPPGRAAEILAELTHNART